MTADLQNSRHQLGKLVGVNKRENYYELHYATGEIARVYLIANGIFRYWLDPSQEFAETNDMLVKGIEPDRNVSPGPRPTRPATCSSSPLAAAS